VEIVNNCITTQDHEEHIEGVDWGGLNQSRHARQPMPGGTLTDAVETTPMKKPVEEPPETPTAKPATKTELNKVISVTLRRIDPTCGFWSKIAQRGKFNKSEFAEVGSKGKPIKQTIQSKKTTKVPEPQHTADDDQRLIFKRDWKITATTNEDR
jgi:hypothetical protein